MANIRKWLEDAEAKSGEKIEAIVVGQHYNRPNKYSGEDEPEANENIVLSREVGLEKLDQEYDSGFGGADCYPMYAWSATRVYFINEYDGSTGLNWVPRQPVACEPDFGG